MQGLNETLTQHQKSGLDPPRCEQAPVSNLSQSIFQLLGNVGPSTWGVFQSPTFESRSRHITRKHGILISKTNFVLCSTSRPKPSVYRPLAS